jgi:Flp pilus assembly pilin Flp
MIRNGDESDRGASVVEYALLVALIAFVCLSALTFFGMTNGGSVNRSASSIVKAEDGG